MSFLPWHPAPTPDPAKPVTKPVVRDQDWLDAPDERPLNPPDSHQFGGAAHCGVGWSTRR